MSEITYNTNNRTEVNHVITKAGYSAKYFNISRADIISATKNWTAAYRTMTIIAGVIAAVAAVTFVFLSNPVGWTLAASAVFCLGIGLACLAGRHVYMINYKLKGDTLSEMAVGSLYSVTAFVITGLFLLVIVALSQSREHSRNSGGGSWTNGFFTGYLLGSWQPRTYTHCCNHRSSNDTLTSARIEDPIFKTSQNPKELYIYKDDVVTVPMDQA